MAPESTQPIEPQPSKPAPERSRATRALAFFVIAVVLAALTGAAGFGGYAWAMHRSQSQKPSFATVDLIRINDIEQLRVATLMLNPTGTDADRAAASKLTDNFAGDLTGAVQAVQKECACTLFVRAAVVTPAVGVPDLTPRLMQLLNINDKMDGELQARMKGYLSVTGAQSPTASTHQGDDLVGLLSKLQQTAGAR
jgi:hypothetical protein